MFRQLSYLLFLFLTKDFWSFPLTSSSCFWRRLWHFSLEQFKQGWTGTGVNIPLVFLLSFLLIFAYRYGRVVESAVLGKWATVHDGEIFQSVKKEYTTTFRCFERFFWYHNYSWKQWVNLVPRALSFSFPGTRITRGGSWEQEWKEIFSMLLLWNCTITITILLHLSLS